MEHLLQVPKCRKLPFSHKDGEEQRMFLFFQRSGPIRGPSVNRLGGPLAPSLGLLYGKSQLIPMSPHHPLNIHLSWASKVQYIMYPILFPLCSSVRPVGKAPIEAEIS